MYNSAADLPSYYISYDWPSSTYWLNGNQVARTVLTSTLIRTGNKYNSANGYETNVLFTNPPPEGKNGTIVITPSQYAVGETINTRTDKSGYSYGSAIDISSTRHIVFSLAALIIIFIIWRGSDTKPEPFVNHIKKQKSSENLKKLKPKG